jgi:hypothetical protein
VSLLDKVNALIRRAVDPGASEEERRTSAHLAARLIHERGLSVGAPESETRWASEPEPEARRSIIRSRFETYCRACVSPIQIGELCAWRKGSGVLCRRCYLSAGEAA